MYFYADEMSLFDYYKLNNFVTAFDQYWRNDQKMIRKI